MHHGIDIGAPEKAKIVAAHDGKVIISTNAKKGYGGLVVINSQSKMGGRFLATYYAHLFKDTRTVDVDDIVTKEQHIAGVGSTGISTGDHLHFEVRDIPNANAAYYTGKLLDPMTFYNRKFEGIELASTYDTFLFNEPGVYGIFVDDGFYEIEYLSTLSEIDRSALGVTLGSFDLEFYRSKPSINHEIRLPDDEDPDRIPLPIDTRPVLSE